jgi:hypothetical protein
MKRKSVLCGHNAEFHHVKEGATYSNHWLNGYWSLTPREWQGLSVFETLQRSPSPSGPRLEDYIEMNIKETWCLDVAGFISALFKKKITSVALTYIDMSVFYTDHCIPDHTHWIKRSMTSTAPVRKDLDAETKGRICPCRSGVPVIQTVI